MKKICAVSGKPFEITDRDLAFYEKMGVPTPTLCPEERMRRRMAFRNEWKLYKRKCSLCAKSIISVYAPDKLFPVYCPECWWSDKWSPAAYEQDVDFTKSFFEQFKKLYDRVPKISLMIDDRSENCSYSPYLIAGKNCYLCISGAYLEDCYYCYFVQNKKGHPSCNCVDCAYSRYCELCYECTDCIHCYEVSYGQNCRQCTNCAFVYNCFNCQNCFGCTNLNNKQYYLFNAPCTKEEFEKKKKEILESSSRTKILWQQFQDFKKTVIHRAYEGRNNENVSGNFINNSKNSFHCYDIEDTEDCAHCSHVIKAKDCSDLQYLLDAQMCYEGLSVPGCFDSAFLDFVWNSSSIFYSSYCFYSHDLFGCVGMKHGKYCIFNKQYSKEEFFTLREKIVTHMKKTGEWGEFFPIDMSPFAYNETIAQEYFPLKKSEAGKWRQEDKKEYQPMTYHVPDVLLEVQDDILDQLLACEATGKNYKIQKAELEFYRKIGLAIPRFCPEARHRRRILLRNPRRLWSRKCDKCSTNIETTFAPDCPEKVYCEKCYLECVN